MAVTEWPNSNRKLAFGPLHPVEDRHVRYTEMDRELSHGEAGRPQPRDLGHGRAALDATWRAKPDAGGAQAYAHRRR